MVCLFILPCYLSSLCFYFVIFSVTTCTICIGGPITTIASLFVSKYIMFEAKIIVVRQPSGYGARLSLGVGLYVDISLAIFFLFKLYSLWKINIPYHTMPYYIMPGLLTLLT